MQELCGGFNHNAEGLREHISCLVEYQWVTPCLWNDITDSGEIWQRMHLARRFVSDCSGYLIMKEKERPCHPLSVLLQYGDHHLERHS